MHELWQAGQDGRSPQGLQLAQQLARELGAPVPGLSCPRPSFSGTAVRRLTPTEAERLQGFPDHHTAIQWRGKPAADGPRYRAIGNSMAVPVLRWILTRIEAQSRALEQAA
jgi:DNA (cytosine-5)-methyltransferase 1